MSERQGQGVRLILSDNSLPVLSNEDERLRALHAYGLLDTAKDEFHEEITRLTATALDMPIAVISLVDRDRIWFKSAYGLDITEVPRDPTFCSSAILSDSIYEIEDTHLIHTSSQLVTGVLAVRYYAAAPLIDPDDFRLGTLCVLDQKPRKLSAENRTRLQQLAAVVMNNLQSIKH